MRCFLGLPVNDALARQLRAYCAALPAGQARWEVPEDWHLTLVFLGDVQDATLASLMPGIAEVCRQGAPLAQGLAGPVPFPGPGSRILAMEGVPVSGLAALQQRLARVAETAGYVPETRPFRPHLTLARQHRAGPVPQIPALLEADRVVLYRSGEPDQAGRRYTALASWRLGGEG